jgi:peptidyl-prolyl cis-trans isomerase C
MLNWLKDPVTSFVIAGTAIFLLSGMFSDSEISKVIELSDDDVDRLSGNWRMQRSREPSAEELQDIVEQFVQDEVYFRESQRLGLDVNDAIIRRRLVQKLTFLTEDIASIQPLSAAEIQSFFDENIEAYREPVRISFTHHYFSSERRENAQADAKAALDTNVKGDPFMLQNNYTDRTLGQIRGFLGDEFVEALDELEPSEAWQGPIKSAYGWHIVKVHKKADSFIPELAAIADRVAADAAVAVRSNASETYYQELKGRYEIIYPDSMTAAK